MEDTKIRSRIADNPFYVLGVPPESSRAEVEREGQKLLGMLELGLRAARQFRTPLGARERTPEMVREALAELRDPQKRLLHELWARLDPDVSFEEVEAAAAQEETEAPGPWPEARTALGWRRR